ncbi:unnamed protein product [Rotaria sp. Silwood1]|nr:unnamed protein product [Rotaria sp. Silwood1]CAF5020736.1 unnamed protein product [Rotaria sp. Silwood1]CAF5045496.1 unnamed protein product [Rotaria sp. Silwood1]CAF5139354.1 unnamed protein product [Rotaria sp. Silwood1]
MSTRIQYAQTADTIGETYFELERYDTALECFFISLNIKLKRLVINDVRTAETLMNIALAIYTTNKCVNTIHILNRIGTIYENIHKYRLAIQYYTKALEAFENYFLSDDSVKQACENNLARIKWLIK